MTQFLSTPHEYLHFWFEEYTQRRTIEIQLICTQKKTIARFGTQNATHRVLSKRMGSMKHHKLKIRSWLLYCSSIFGVNERQYDRYSKFPKKKNNLLKKASAKWTCIKQKKYESIVCSEKKVIICHRIKKSLIWILEYFSHCHFVYIWNAIDRNSMNCRNVISIISETEWSDLNPCTRRISLTDDRW